MDTLSNVHTMSSTEGFGFASIAIPEAKSSKTGVSVRYVHDGAKCWFVLRAPYRRENMAHDLFVEQGHYAYVPQRWVWHEVDGKRKHTLESLIPSLLFVYMHPQLADLLVRNNHAQKSSPCPELATLVSYYYNHFVEDEQGYNPPLTVADRQMENFILGTCSSDENLVVLEPGHFRFRGDETVRVTQGVFRGVTGRVVRARGQQRVLLRLDGVGNVATAYVPSAFLEVIE